MAPHSLIETPKAPEAPSMLVHFVGADIAQMLAEKYRLTRQTDVVRLRWSEGDERLYDCYPSLPEFMPYTKLGTFDPVRLEIPFELMTDGTHLFAAGYVAEHDVVVVRV